MPRTTIIHVVLAGLPLAGCDETRDTKTAKAETKTDTAKQDTKQDTKQEPKQEPEPKPPIVIERPDDIPVALGGAAVPYSPPPPPPPKQGNAGAAAEPSAAAPAAAAAVAPAKPTAITLAHNHAPGETCQSLTREEVERALADLKK
jgi:hypothetical protein